MKKYLRLKALIMGAAFLFVSLIMTPSHIIYAQSNVTIYWDDVRQEIDGFGFSQTGNQATNLYNLEDSTRQEVLDILFSRTDGMGASILRTEVLWDFCPEPGVYDPTVGFEQAWVMQQAQNQYNVDKLISTVWTPPLWMKTENSINGGKLKYECYDDYAEYLANYITQYEENYGLDFYGISISNEPEPITDIIVSWQCCTWSGEETKTFIRDYIKQAFSSHGINDVKVIANESAFWRDRDIKPTLEDPAACANLDIVGMHSYQQWLYPVKYLSSPKQHNKKLWMTEVSDTGELKTDIDDGLYWAKNVHDFMTKAEANAYLYWLGAVGSRVSEGLVYIDIENNTYEARKALYTLGNYSRFIRPEYVRINTSSSNPASGVYLSAYKDPQTGDFAIVAINDNNSTVDVQLSADGFSAAYITPYVTNANNNLELSPNIYANDINSNNTYTLHLSPNSVTTFTGANGSTGQIQTLTDGLDDWSKTHAHSEGMILDSTNPNKFDGDTSRVKRMNEENQNIIYHVNNINNFEATMYHYKAYDDINFYISSDGENWQKIQHESTDGVWTDIVWRKKTYMPLENIPTGTNYLKIEIAGAGAWEKQLGEVKIFYKE
ncbi:glycoside hydrolase family 30 protein [Vallitalea maricola]|uniref:Uncharacterized protein n=1 Tax=Vallitalea maricola TaxID=3074433 RepID=A0ACB5URI5_9FIRM|nr:hypothetical protein AN2V17_38100 [Vallitalea sp. AN17-2]